MDTFVLIVLLLGFFLSTTPIGVAFIATTAILYLAFTDIPLLTIANGLFSKLDSFPLEAVLFFILLGNLMTRGDSSKYLINFTKTLMHGLPGGLGIAGITSCAIFGAISGSGTATVVAIGTILVPAMVEEGYDKSFSVGLLTSSAILGVIIPPSIIMILYSVVANVSMAKLFLGGFIPGILIAAALSVYTFWVRRKQEVEVKAARPPKAVFNAARQAVWALFLPFLILGGIYGGVFTPTEAAVAGCVYAVIIECFIHRTLDVRKILEVLKSAGITTGTLLITLAGASIFSDYLTLKQIPQELSAFVTNTIKSPAAFLLMTNLLFLFLGTFIDGLSAIIVVAPLLVPTVLALNIDPIFLGVILTINLGIGYCTPPLGGNLFVASLVLRESYANVARAVIPTIIIYLIMLAVFNFFPKLITFLPNLIM